MELFTSDDIIIACSSGNQSNTAISVIRISGNFSLPELNDYFTADLANLKPRFNYFSKLYNEKYEVLDEIIFCFFKGPHSYNGENILELFVHGNMLNVNRIISFFINRFNFRYASPGEFTYRALRNKKLSLSQVEGLDSFLNASSYEVLNSSISILSGSINMLYENLLQSYLNHKSAIEIGFDFLDDIGEEGYNTHFDRTLNTLEMTIKNLRSKVNNSGFNILKPEIALIGSTNAGKSTLFNILLNESRSIVSPVEGTTRDYVSEDLNIENTLFKLIDTAGIRETDDIVEEKGITKSLEFAKTAFYKILLVNVCELSSKPILDLDNFDIVLFTHLDVFDGDFDALISEIECSSNYKLIEATIIKNSSGPIGPEINGSMRPNSGGPIGPEIDGSMGAKLSGPIGPEINGSMGLNSGGPIGPEKDGSMGANSGGPIGSEKDGSMGAKSSGPIGPDLNINNIRYMAVSLPSINSDNLLLLQQLIFSKFIRLSRSSPISLERHCLLINQIYDLFVDYVKLSNEMDDISIIASEFNTIGRCVEELIGIVSPDDVLNNLFDNFCIGK